MGYLLMKTKLEIATEALKVACIVLADTYREDFIRVLGADGVRKLLDDTKHLDKDFRVEEYLHNALMELEKHE